jgi:hypothetical protein
VTSHSAEKYQTLKFFESENARNYAYFYQTLICSDNTSWRELIDRVFVVSGLSGLISLG